MIDRETALPRTAAAAEDDTSRAVRERVARELARTFVAAGELLWIDGYVVGPDRPDGRSPFGFGSDATVGVALIGQIAGELMAGTITLLEDDNLYSAGALLRQMVEVEYLAWAFSEDRDEAARWMRSTHDERRQRWQPPRLRDRSGDRFRRLDYQLHCERGGHPTPHAMDLLPGHSRKTWPELLWLDLAEHGVSTWEYLTAAAEGLGQAGQLRAVAGAGELPDTIASWVAADRPDLGVWLADYAREHRPVVLVYADGDERVLLALPAASRWRALLGDAIKGLSLLFRRAAER